MQLDQITVARDATHHEFEGQPLYEARFTQVLKYHPPGLAAVADPSGSYHITTDGCSAYPARFNSSFGFYDGLAAVSDATGWFHITLEGVPAYRERYSWCGNFQGGLVPVRDGAGHYFHLDLHGRRPYAESYRYAGDYRDGVACVRRLDGACVHIDRNGRPVHSQSFLELDVFHKGFARARDGSGWFHIRADGSPAYGARFVEVEAFYNGQAYVRDWSGRRLVISESGAVLQKVWQEWQAAPTSGELTIVLIGTCGVGKTTLGKAIAILRSIPLLSIDDFRRHASDGSPAGEVRAWALFLEAIAASARAVVEFSGSGHFAHLVKMQMAAKRDYRVLWLQAAPEVCLQRVASRPLDVPYPDFGTSLDKLVPELHQRLRQEIAAGTIWPREWVQALDASREPALLLEEALQQLEKEGQ